MEGLELHLLGRLEIRCGGKEIEHFETRKVHELLCYLALHPDRAQTRDALSALLWGDVTSAQAKGYLRKALWQLQAALAPIECVAEAGAILADAEWVRWNPQAPLWVDAAALETAFLAVKDRPGRALEPGEALAIQQAAALYRGELMEGWYQDWCQLERQRTQFFYLALLDKLMDFCEARLDCETGLFYGEQILRYDHARERTHRKMMRLYALTGDRTAALRQYERCAGALRDELDVQPSKRTRHLYELIQRDALAGADAPTVPLKPPVPSNGVVSRLVHLQHALTRIQTDLRREIHGLQEAREDPPRGS